MRQDFLTGFGGYGSFWVSIRGDPKDMWHLRIELHELKSTLPKEDYIGEYHMGYSGGY